MYSTLVRRAAVLDIDDDHRQYVLLEDDRRHAEAVATFTSVAHESRHFHDLVMTPYGSALMAQHMRAAFAVQTSLGSLASSDSLILPLHEWDKHLPLLRLAEPSLRAPGGRLAELAQQLSETTSALAGLDRGVRWPDEGITATQILEANAYLIQQTFAKESFHQRESLQLLDDLIERRGASRMYRGAVQYVQDHVGVLPNGALSIVFLASLSGDYVTPSEHALRNPVDMLGTLMRFMRTKPGVPFDMPRDVDGSFERIGVVWKYVDEFFRTVFAGRTLVDMLARGVEADEASVKVWEDRIAPVIEDDSLQSLRLEQTLRVYRSFARLGRVLAANFARKPSWYTPAGYVRALPYLPRPITFFTADGGVPATPELTNDFYMVQESICDPKAGSFRALSQEVQQAVRRAYYDDGSLLRSARVISPKTVPPGSPPNDLLPLGTEPIDLEAWRGYFDSVVPQLRLLTEGIATKLPKTMRDMALDSLARNGTRVFTAAGEVVPHPSAHQLVELDTRYPNWPSID